MKHKVTQGKYTEAQQQSKTMPLDRKKASQGNILDTDIAQQDGPLKEEFAHELEDSYIQTHSK